MDSKTHSPPSPPPGYQQTMQNVNNEQLGFNQTQNHQHQYQPSHQHQQSFPMQPRMPPPIVNEQGS